jgi:uncharacterized membrane protein
MKTADEKRSVTDYLVLTLKGVGMGAADVVPGVSGDAMAFIFGIYIFSVAKGIGWMLFHHPVYIWSFFLGLFSHR